MDVKEMENNSGERSLKQKTVTSMIWKLLERFAVQGIAFVVSIVIARILDTGDYGVMSILTVFTSLASIFVHSGLNTALIQRNDVTENDFSTVFWTSTLIALVLYLLLYLCAPWIAALYELPELVPLLRVIGLILFFYAINSIQIAKVTRELKFKYIFVSNLVAGLLSGVVGIAMAMNGFGVWALVWQQLSNSILICLVMLATARLKIRLHFSMARFKVMFNFGGKLMLAQLINNIKMDLSTLLIGGKYNTDSLGIYNRGKQFPQFVISCIDTAMNSVLLPVYSRAQSEPERLKQMMRRAIKTCSAIVVPIMFGMCMLAEPIVVLLLTEKWLPCVPYLQICCLAFAIRPIHTANLQALSATGRSGIYAGIEIVKLVITWAVLAVALLCFDSLIAVAVGDALVLIGTLYVNAAPNKKYLKYSLLEQLRDILPSILISLVMAAAMYLVSLLELSLYLDLILQFLVGFATYMALFATLQKKEFMYLLNTALSLVRRRR